MKVMDCREVRLQVDDAELGQSLPSELSTHLRTCDQCQTFYEDRNKLRQLVGSLGQVKAPADFDFRLRARLAATEKRPRFLSFVGLSFGIPTAAVAAIVMVIGGVLFLRSTEPIPPAPVAEVATEKVETPKAPVSTTSAAALNNVTSKATASKPDRRTGQKQTQVAVNPRNRPATREFSSVPAPVMKQDDSLAAVSAAFPIDSPQQSLKLSLDDGTGVYRTISVPRVSFGSQRTFGEQTSFVKTSSNGIW